MWNRHESRCLPHLLLLWLLIFAGNQLNAASATTQLDLPPIPQLCDGIQCPDDAEMQCPEDSAIREMSGMNAVDLLDTNSLGGIGATLTTTSTSTTEKAAYNSSLVPDELFAQCCLSKKCVCKTCYIPDCDVEGEVVVELQPEAMDTPGQCCGRYECQREPNCTEVWDNEFYWLQSCQRCQCNSGERICQQSCDEGAKSICKSQSLNAFFTDGDSWEDGCYQCECVRGESKCVIPFCGNLNCPRERQVQLKDSCCPVCWPKGNPMPHEKPRNYDDGYGYKHQQQHQHEHQEQPQHEAHLESSPDTETPTVSSAITTTTSTSTSAINSSSSSAAAATPPCQLHDFPKVVEVVHQNGFLGHLYPIIIGCLLLVIAALISYIMRLHAKQRSYSTVSNFDDKV